MVGNRNRHNYTAFRSTTNKIPKTFVVSFVIFRWSADEKRSNFHVNSGILDTDAKSTHKHIHRGFSVSAAPPCSLVFPFFLGGIFDRTFALHSLTFESNFIQIHIGFFTLSFDIPFVLLVWRTNISSTKINDFDDDGGKGRYFSNWYWIFVARLKI